MLSLRNAIRIKLTHLRALAHSADALGKAHLSRLWMREEGAEPSAIKIRVSVSCSDAAQLKTLIDRQGDLPPFPRTPTENIRFDGVLCVGALPEYRAKVGSGVRGS